MDAHGGRKVFCHAQRLVPARVPRAGGRARGLFDGGSAYRLTHLQDQAQPGKEGRALCPVVDGKVRRHAHGHLVRPAAFRRRPRGHGEGREAGDEAGRRRPRSARHPLRRHPHEPRRERRLQAHGERRYASALRHAGSLRQLPQRRGCGCGREGGRDPRRGSEPVCPHARDGLWREERISARAAAGRPWLRVRAAGGLPCGSAVRQRAGLLRV